MWGVDLGGTKVEGVVLSSSDSPEPLARVRMPTEAERGYEGIVGQVARVVEALGRETGSRPAAVGVGTPGVLDPETKLLKNSNTVCLIGRPLRDDLARAIGARVVLANDANCFALAEARWGAARGAETVFGVIIGTGVGGGIVVGGRALTGRQGIAGEWGHVVLDPQGPECYCGRRGCVERFISGPALEEYYASLSGVRRRLSEIAGQEGVDPHAGATLDRLVDCFGRALSYVVNILDPHVVVLGGGVSNIERLYTDGPAAVERWTFHDRLETPIVRNHLGDSAGVFGAALLTDFTKEEG